MKIKKFLQNENGYVAVIVALSMTMILGFTAFVVDYGQMANKRRLLQNAADAAALAAAIELPADTGLAINRGRNAALSYAGANGVSDTGTNVTVSHPSTSEVKVEVKQQVPLSFAQVITGKKEAVVKASATAKKTEGSSDFKYAMFSGSGTSIGTTIYWGDNSYVIGDMHSNSNMRVQNTIITGTATAVGINYDEVIITPHAPSVTPPDFAGFLAGKDIVTLTHAEVLSFAPNPWDIGYYSSGGKYVYSFHVDGILDSILSAPQYSGKFVRIDGSLTLNNGSGDLPYGNLIVSKDIVINGTYTGSGDPYPPGMTCLISETGNITFNNKIGKVAGLFYAPAGTVTLNGIETMMYGKIIADKIICNNGIKIDGTYDISPILGGELKIYLSS